MVQASQPEVGEQLLEVAFRHPIKLVANALGIAPQSMIDRAKAAGIPVAALVGSKEHAVRQVAAGVDIIVAQGTEAGAHCGEVSTLVLTPEVVRAVRQIRDVPVLAAGGIVTGQQMAAVMAMGASGAWTGSVWLATSESEVSETFREKMIAARSRDTVRSRARTGKPCRQLRSAWHDAWEGADAPSPLGMPLQGYLSIPALNLAEHAADLGRGEARELVSYYVGQGVGLIESIRPATAVVQTFKEEFAEALENLQTLVV
jgi:NAD(P)H-dependent flavin oxidoreductase YrpB (nitropropane dioxygenase family)